MIFGIGTDLVFIPRMEALLLKHGDKIAMRILTDTEYNDFQQANKPANFLAKRFAAKEATAKALGTGFRNGLSLTHIAVTNNEQGKPELDFSHRGAELLAELNISRHFVSLSDEQDYAMAYVMLEE